MDDLARALDVAVEAAGRARAILLRECALSEGPRGEIGHSPADDEAEWAIRDHLLEAFPDFGYLGEETGHKPPADNVPCVWVVDPNDGTSSMQRGYRGHAVSIGLVRHGLPALGVVWAVDAPDDRGDLFAWAEECGPLLRNGAAVEPIVWPNALQAGDVVGLSQGANRNPVGNLECVAPARFMAMPSIAYRLALVAAGDWVATVSLNYLSAWDYAAGHALVRGAGGVVLDARGQPITYVEGAHGPTTRIFGGGEAVVRELLERPWQHVPRSGFGDATPPPALAPARAAAGRLVHDSRVLSRAHGCMLGQIAGDALGALVEFQSAEAIARKYPDGGPRRLVDGGPHGIMAGQPTDDSELALMLARSLVATDDFDQSAVAAMYARWFHGWTHSDVPETCGHSFCAPFDVGGTTRQALEPLTITAARDARAAEGARAAASRRSQANGALMRVSPLGIWGTFRQAEEVASAARLDAQLTHPHAVCQDASAILAVTLAAAIRSGLDAARTYAFGLDWARTTGVEPTVLEALTAAAHAPPRDYLTQQGWVLVALQNAFFRLLHASNFAAGVIQTVRAGGDTDTNAAICGALLGAVHGREAIPAQWQAMVLTCRPMPGAVGVAQPRPAIFWPTDALVLAERLVATRAVNARALV